MSSAPARKWSTSPATDTSPSILIMSELPAEGGALAGVLQTNPFHVILVNSPVAAKAELATREFAAIVCVCASKGGAMSGQLDSMAALREHRFNAFTPLLLLVPPTFDQAGAMRALGVGVVDCIIQPVDDLVLQSKVRMFVEMYRNKQRLREIEAQGSALLTDPLTGLPNRLLFMDRADQAMRQAARSGGRVALASMDLEQIVEVKESLGPATGDELLRQIALRLTGVLRRSDTVARTGDAAFGAILACDTRDGVETVTSRLERVMSEPFAVGGHRITVGGGIGVALFPDHGRDPFVLMDRAQAVMSIAKQNSLGHLFFDPIHHADSEEGADSAEMNAEELFKVSAA